MELQYLNRACFSVISCFVFPRSLGGLAPHSPDAWQSWNSINSHCPQISFPTKIRSKFPLTVSNSGKGRNSQSEETGIFQYFRTGIVQIQNTEHLFWQDSVGFLYRGTRSNRYRWHLHKNSLCYLQEVSLHEPSEISVTSSALWRFTGVW